MQLRGDINLTWCVVALSLFVLVAVTIAGNVAVVTAIRRAAPRFSTHYPLASLAVADLTLGVFVLPISALRELFVFHPEPTICTWWRTLDVLCCTASILSLCVLGWERWCGIATPLARAQRSRRARLYSAMIWPVAAAVAIPTAFVPTHVHWLSGEIVKACTVNTNVGYVFFSVTFSFYLPASGMMFLYTKILLALAHPPPVRTHRVRTPAGLNKTPITKPPPTAIGNAHTPLAPRRLQFSDEEFNADSSQAGSDRNKGKAGGVAVEDGDKNNNDGRIYKSRNSCHLNLPQKGEVADNIPTPLKARGSPGGIIPRQRRATKTIITLMSVFLLCWWPFFVMLPVDSICECVSDNIWLVCTWLGYANSALDPLIYAAASPTVRRALMTSFSFSSSRVRSQEVPLTPQIRRQV